MDGPAGELDLPPEVGHRSAGNVAVAFFGEDFCDQPTCFNDTCLDDTCPDPTCFEGTCAHHSCHHQTCADATAVVPPVCEGLSCDANSCADSCGDSCQAPLSCDGESCFPAGGSCPADSCLDGVSVCNDDSGGGAECTDNGSDCGAFTDDCPDATCEDNTDCLHTVPIKEHTPETATPGELAQLHRELDGLQADTTG
jgi:hypothetical protein